MKNKLFKTKFFQSHLFSVICIFLLLPGLLLHAQNNQESKKDQEAQLLINNAAVHYKIPENYSIALNLLNQAVNMTKNPRIQAEAWLKIGYVRFLLKQSKDLFIPYIKTALELEPGLDLDPGNYETSFIGFFKQVKNNPEDPTLTSQSSNSGTISREQLIELQGDIAFEEKQKRKKFFFRIGGNALMHADSDYREVYGDIKMLPRVTLGYMIGKRMSLWGGFSYLNTSATIPDTTLEAESKQTFFTFGVGYYLPLSKKIDLKGEMGFMRCKVEEEALDVRITENAGGFSFESGLQFNFSRHFFLDFSVGYMSAATQLENRQAKIGGLFTGLSLGLRL